MNLSLLVFAIIHYFFLSGCIYLVFVLWELSRNFPQLQVNWPFLQVKPIDYDRDKYDVNYYFFFLIVAITWGIWVPMAIYKIVKRI